MSLFFPGIIPYTFLNLISSNFLLAPILILYPFWEYLMISEKIFGFIIILINPLSFIFRLSSYIPLLKARSSEKEGEITHLTFFDKNNYQVLLCYYNYTNLLE